MVKELNSKQQKFIEEYCVSLNATEAAKRAGYSEKTAYSQGQRLLKHVEIKRQIASRISKAAHKAEVRLDEIMSELGKLAFANMADFCEWDNTTVTVKSSDLLPRDLLAAVESVAETADKAGNRLIKIRLHSKLRAIQSILKLYEVSELETRIAALEDVVLKQ